MARMFVLAIAAVVAAFGSAHAQTGNPATAAPGSIGGSSGASAPGANSSASDPALSLHGMPCSVSLNATGGVTTSSSCGSDPLEVPAQTVGSLGGVATGGTQSPARPSSATSSGSAASGASTTAANTSSGAAGAGAPSSSVLCSTSIPTTAGPAGAGSLLGGC